MPTCPICRGSFLGSSCRALHLSGPNGQDVTLSCPICLEVKPDNEFCVLPCGHNLCFQCLPMTQFRRENPNGFVVGGTPALLAPGEPLPEVDQQPPPGAPEEDPQQWIRQNISRRQRVYLDELDTYPLNVQEYIEQNWNNYEDDPQNNVENPAWYRPNSRSDTAAARRANLNNQQQDQDEDEDEQDVDYLADILNQLNF